MIKKEKRELPNIPKKIGSISLKKVKDSYQIVNSNNEVVGELTIPHQCNTYYMPNWSVWKANTLLDCFATLSDAISLIKKTFDKKSKKK